MATDLFSKYYNNPEKSYIYSNMACKGSSADEISFDITGGAGVISDNENVLSSLGLESVHVPLTQYTSDMRVLNPYEIMYVRGLDRGASYMSKTYKLYNDDPIYEDWMYESAITFAIRYTDGAAVKKVYFVKASGDIIEEKTFIEVCQEIFDSQSIPINITYKDGEITFTSTVLGYEFWISHIILWQKTVDPSTGLFITSETLDNIIASIFKEVLKDSHFGFGFDDSYIAENGFIEDNPFTTINAYTGLISNANYEHKYHMLTILNGFEENFIKHENPYVITYFMFENFSKYVPAYKYKNGAMKGCIIVPIYPVYNAENISDYQKALRIVHIQDRVEDYILPIEYDYYNIPLYIRIIRDVTDSFSRGEYETYCKWCHKFKPWILSDDIPGPQFIEPRKINPSSNIDEWSQEYIPDKVLMTSICRDSMTQDFMGLYGYCNFATKHNLWSTFGNFYAKTTIDDDKSTDSRNLIPSFIIYNPNDFPVTVKYMTFS